MHFIGRFLLRAVLTGAALFIAQKYVPGFALIGGTPALIIASLAIAALNTILRPLLKLIFFPIVALSLGLFAIAINMGILWIADQFLDSITIAGLIPLFWTSLLVGIANLI